MMFGTLSGRKGLGTLGTFFERATRSVKTRVRPSTTVLGVEALEARNLLDGTTLLIGTWNVDISDLGYRPSGYATVFAAMGNEYAYYGSPQAPDILTVTEVRSNATSGSSNDTHYLTQVMNGIYGAGVYSHGTLNGQGSGGTEGVIYNTQTVRLLQQTAVGTVSSTGTIRQELRYLLRPVGYEDGSADFYVYAGHYKAGFNSTDQHRRLVEAQQVRANANALGAAAHVLYTGDFNSDSSDEPAEQTLLAPGNGQAFDPIGRLGQWYRNPDMVDIDTNNARTYLDGRLDLLWETAPVVDDYGLQAMPWTYHSLGNNGSVPLYGQIDDPGNTALSELDNQADVLYALAHTTSDHLPVMQEYQIVTPSAPFIHRWGSRESSLLMAVSSPASVLGRFADPVAPAGQVFAGQSPSGSSGTPLFADGSVPGDAVAPPRELDGSAVIHGSTAKKPAQMDVDARAHFWMRVGLETNS